MGSPEAASSMFAWSVVTTAQHKTAQHELLLLGKPSTLVVAAYTALHFIALDYNHMIVCLSTVYC
jgi:hypothetical protein